MADQQDPKAEALGKELAEQMKGKLDADEAHRLQTEDDATYDAQVLTALEKQLKGALEGWNGVAEAADQLEMQKGSSMLQMYKANLPVFAARIAHRRVEILPAMATTAVQSFAVTGGPEEFSYNGQPQAEFVKQLLTMAASGSAGLK